MKQSEEKKKFPNRLRELIEREIPDNITITEKMQRFADDNNIGFDLIKRYVYQSAHISPETASDLSQKYEVTEDWLMSAPLNDYDVVEILKAFSSVLQVRTKREPMFSEGKRTAYTVRTLYMDEKFFSFLVAVQELQYAKRTDISLDDESYKRRMNKIISEYKDYFIMKFKTESFDESRALEIDNLELLL